MPSRLQYVFAKDWPLYAYFALAASLGLWAAVSGCQPSAALFHDWQYALSFVVCVIVAPIFAFFLSLPCIPFFLGPIYFWRAKLNGSPFYAGDRVRILVGPHRDKIVTVYEVWSERNQVRVELDTQAKADVTDVFSFTQVCRASAG